MGNIFKWKKQVKQDWKEDKRGKGKNNQDNALYKYINEQRTNLIYINKKPSFLSFMIYADFNFSFCSESLSLWNYLGKILRQN